MILLKRFQDSFCNGNLLFLKQDIDRLELNLEIDSIVGRVKREEHIENTKLLTSSI